jgi:hypothetical protein
MLTHAFLEAKFQQRIHEKKQNNKAWPTRRSGVQQCREPLHWTGAKHRLSALTS